MGQGKVDPAPPTPINTARTEEKKEEKKRDWKERDRRIFRERKGRIWSANTFPLRSQFPYLISETS